MYIFLVILSVFAAACAQMFLKQGARQGYVPFWRQYVNQWVAGGYAVLLGSMMLNVFCMNHGVQMKEVSVIESLGYMFVPALSLAFFRENLTWRKVFAIAVIMSGIVVFFI